MNISQVLHPELLYNLRGDKNHREWLKLLVGRVFVNPSGGISFDYEGAHPSAVAAAKDIFERKDRPFIDFLLLCAKFRKDEGKTYYLPKDFCTALSKIDKTLNLDYLPGNFIGFFAFPKDFIKDRRGLTLTGAYVFCGKSDELPLPKGIPAQKFFHAVLIHEKEGVFKRVSNAYLPLDGDKTMWENVEYYYGDSGIYQTDDKLLEDEERLEIIRFSGILLNAVLFVHNEDEDILRLKPASNPAKKNGKPVKISSGVAINNCSIPVELVNFNFHRRTNYSIDSTSVKGHFRWQPHGQEKAKLKLIWIAEHIRKFNNDSAPPDE